MPIHDFDAQKEQFITIDEIQDNRSELEKQLSPLSVYNHNKPDIALAERYVEEFINVSGAWVSIFPRIPKEKQELNVWDEDENPIYGDPIDLKAYFSPDPVSWELTRWGEDNPLKVDVVFSRAILLKRLGDRLLVQGDVIELPYNEILARLFPVGPWRVQVLNGASTGNFHYRWLYYTVNCELMIGDEADQVLTKGVGGRKSAIHGLPNRS